MAATSVVSDYFSKSLYPAHVAALNFDHVLDAAHAISYDAWTVRFGLQSPIAELENNAPVPLASTVHVKGLTCANAITGDKPCEVKFLFVPAAATGMSYDQKPCLLGIESDSKSPVWIDVNCPKSLTLEQ